MSLIALIYNPDRRLLPPSGLRISDFGLLSTFGFRISGFKHI